ncbi:DNA-binding protein [candidate division TA06 bacterium]|uniref:DNA-binding protein n=1 Tax=candidate division TA06 bacterium TaxID=2250710 RepID=A0A523UX67_UNCT6|nr:MAG: DNA-binding protein [candidate division TA06 bacterium]
MEEQLLNKKEVAELLHTTTRHVMDLARRGDLPSLKVGRLIRFRRKDIEKFIELQRDKRSFTLT